MNSAAGHFVFYKGASTRNSGIPRPHECDALEMRLGCLTTDA